MTAAVVGVGLVIVPAPRPVSAEPLPDDPIMYVEPFCFVDTNGVQSIVLRGRNFRPGARLIVTDYLNFGEQGYYVDVIPDEYGNFTATLNIDTTYQPNLRIDAYEPRLEQTHASAYVGGCGSDALVVATPNCVDPNDPVIRVHGERFPFSSNIRIELTDGSSPVGETMFIPGAFSFDVDYRPGTALKPGHYTLQVSQSAGEFYAFGYDQVVVPCPRVTVEPVCTNTIGAPPDRMSIFVTGTGGWLPGTADGYDEIQVVFDLYGHPQEFFFHANPYEGEVGINPDDGSFATLEIDPFVRPRGTYTIQVKQQGYGEHPIVDQLITFMVPCLTPTLTLDPECGPPEIIGDEPRSYSIRASGGDFLGGLPVTVTFDPDLAAGSDYPPVAVSTFTGRDGTFSTVFDVPYRPPGTYRVVASQQTRFGVYEANAFFGVPCVPPAPVLAIDPTCGPVATNLPAAYTIDVTGSGFVPGHVDLVFDPTAPVPETAATVADEDGAFLFTMQVTGRPPGAWLFVASQTTAVGVIAEASVPFLVACEGVLLRITPTNGSRGFVPTVEGFNFPPLTELILRWDIGIGAGRPMPVVTDENGSFRRQVLIFRGDFIGMRHMTVELATDPLAYPEVQADYRVTQNTVSPPFRLNDNPIAGPDATIVLRP